MARGTVPGVVERERGSGIWWIRWTDHQGKRHWEKVGRKADANTLISKRRADSQLRRKLPELFRGGVTFGQLMDDAIAYSREANGVRSTAEIELKYQRIRRAFGSRIASSIKTHEISEWLLRESENHDWTPGTRNRYMSAVSLAFRVGIDNERVESNPCRRLKRKKESQGRTRFLTSTEEEALRKTIAKRCPANLPAFEVSLHTGLRASEQWRLVWADVDFEQRILTARATKNGDPERHIPLNIVAWSALQERKSVYPQPVRQEDRVFLNAHGNPVLTHRDWFEPVLAEAGVVNYTWHANRHTFASRLVIAGVNLKAVQTLMGHRTIAMTMRYSHLAPEHLQEAVATLALDRSPEPVVTKVVTSAKARGGRRAS